MEKIRLENFNSLLRVEDNSWNLIGYKRTVVRRTTTYPTPADS